MSPKPDCQDRAMPGEDFDALCAALHDAVRQMSSEQVIDLADGLFDYLRKRRGFGDGERAA